MSVILINLYKSWYIVTAVVISFTTIFLLSGVFKTRGLIQSTIFIVTYYGYLLTTSIWAEFPKITIFYVFIESIFISIFILFYILSLNYTYEDIIRFFVYLVPPAVIIFIVSFIVDPNALRLGGNVLIILPFLSFFCVLLLIYSFSILNLIILVPSCLLMLMLGMSRAPILITGLGFFLMFLTITKRFKSRCKLITVFISSVLIITIAATTSQSVRLNIAKLIARTVYHDVAVDDQVVEAEKPDFVRWRIYDDARLLYKKNWLIGIGYMNFMPWFGNTYNYTSLNTRGKEIVGMNLHNIYQTWALEGGLPCLIIVILLLWNYFKILIKKIRLSEKDFEKSYYKLLLIMMICLLVEGLFHQINQAPVFFILMGIVYALKYKTINRVLDKDNVRNLWKINI